MTLLVIQIGAFSLVIAYLVASDVVDGIACRQRLDAINAIYSDQNWMALSCDFRQVSFEQHCARLITLRSPWALYSPAIQALMNEGRA